MPSAQRFVFRTEQHYYSICAVFTLSTVYHYQELIKLYKNNADDGSGSSGGVVCQCMFDLVDVDTCFPVIVSEVQMNFSAINN